MKFLGIRDWMFLTLAVGFGIANPWDFLPMPTSCIVLALGSRNWSNKKVLMFSILKASIGLLIALPNAFQFIMFSPILILSIVYFEHCFYVFFARSKLKNWLM